METAVKERSASFTGVMSKSILENRKRKTRRVIKQVPTYHHLGRPIMDWGLSGVYKDGDGRWWLDVQTDIDDNSTEELVCPYGNVGDRLYVKEESWRWGKWVRDGLTKTGRRKFRFRLVGKKTTFERPGKTAKRDGSEGWVYRHARFMPRTESRITLEITDIGIERVQDITEEDARAEGFPLSEGLPGTLTRVIDGKEITESATHYVFDPVLGFRMLWDALNKDRGFGWDVNPWVWVISFNPISRETP